MVLLPIFFNALLIKVFSTFAVFDSTNTPCGVHRCYCFSIWICFDEVVRNSRSIPNWNWTNNFLLFPERNRKFFRNKNVSSSRKSIKFSRVGRKRGNKQYFNFGPMFMLSWLGNFSFWICFFGVNFLINVYISENACGILLFSSV